MRAQETIEIQPVDSGHTRKAKEEQHVAHSSNDGHVLAYSKSEHTRSQSSIGTAGTIEIGNKRPEKARVLRKVPWVWLSTPHSLKQKGAKSRLVGNVVRSALPRLEHRHVSG